MLSTWLKSATLEVQEYVLLLGRVARGLVTRPFYPRDGSLQFKTQAEVDQHITMLQAQMKAAAANLDFEKAAALRDDIKRLRNPELLTPRPARRA